MENELLSFPAFMIARSNMPQIHELDQFLARLDALGIDYESISTDPINFKPTQVNYDQAKVDQMISSGLSDKPIIASRDGHVADGHHRWLASKQSGNQIKAIVVDLTINQLLALMIDDG